MAVSFELGETTRMVRDAARDLARRRIAPGAAARDAAEEFPRAVMKELAEAGLCGVMIPAEFGGAGLDLSCYAAAMTEVAAACASTAVTMAVTNLCAGVIARTGSEAQKRRWIPPLVSGEYAAGAFALSEPGAGSDAASLRCRARAEGDHYVLDGQKQWITSGDVAGVMVVFARTGEGTAGAKGVSAFVVEQGTPGMRVGKPEDKTGLRASHTCPVLFEGARVPAENRLGAEGDGFGIAMQNLAVGRVGIGAQAVGIARAALEEAVAYARQRVQFGRALRDFQAIQMMLADARTELEAGELMVRRAAWAYDRGLPHNRESAAAKLFATEAANRACHACLQVHGGYGYIRDFAVERHLRDVKVTTIYEGTSEVQRLIIARDVVAALRDRAG
jgi:alkylation response protein AidB-like acyl-CoA dehydrogenase